jgi:DNA-binding MarR family transcriptional regulator
LFYHRNIVSQESFDDGSVVEVFSLVEEPPLRDESPVTPADLHLFEALLSLLRAKESASEGLEEQAAAALGVHRTAARCVEILLEESSLSAGELAERAGVSRSGTTPLLDQLEEAGIIQRRRPSDEDRRRVVIELTAVGRAAAERFWDDLFDRLARLAQGYSREELHVVLDFLGRANVILSGHEPPVRTVIQGGIPSSDEVRAPGVRPPTLGSDSPTRGSRSRTTLGSPAQES